MLVSSEVQMSLFSTQERKMLQSTFIVPLESKKLMQQLHDILVTMSTQITAEQAMEIETLSAFFADYFSKVPANDLLNAHIILEHSLKAMITLCASLEALAACSVMFKRLGDFALLHGEIVAISKFMAADEPTPTH